MHTCMFIEAEVDQHMYVLEAEVQTYPRTETARVMNNVCVTTYTPVALIKDSHYVYVLLPVYLLYNIVCLCVCVCVLLNL